MMKVTKATMARRCDDGVWSVEFEPNRSGVAMVQSNSSKKRFSVQVTDWDR